MSLTFKTRLFCYERRQIWKLEPVERRRSLETRRRGRQLSRPEMPRRRWRHQLGVYRGRSTGLDVPSAKLETALSGADVVPEDVVLGPFVYQLVTIRYAQRSTLWLEKV